MHIDSFAPNRQWLSNRRNADSIPEDCRRPLATKMAQKKWADQAWQLAIHASMAVWEQRLLSLNPQWWESPETCFEPCPNSHPPSGHPDAELKLFYVVQLSLWIMTGVSCKW